MTQKRHWLLYRAYAAAMNDQRENKRETENEICALACNISYIAGSEYLSSSVFLLLF